MCTTSGATCAADAECCAGLACTGGVCKTPCTAAGSMCSSSATCCDGLSCASGVCSCLAVGDECGADAGQSCCGGLSCDATGHCAAACTSPVGACQPFSGACTTSSDCCSPMSCIAGACRDSTATTPTCATAGRSCNTASDCCGSEMLGSRYDCLPGDGGAKVCTIGAAGAPCDATRHCGPGLACPIDADAGMTVGVCTPSITGAECTIFSPECFVGDACNPASNTNQDNDPCPAVVSGNSLAGRTKVLVCKSGRCALPGLGEGCSRVQGCIQAMGDARFTSCNRTGLGSNVCMPTCTTDGECTGSQPSGASLVPVNYCMGYGRGVGCQPKICFEEGKGNALGNPANLYQPCPNTPNSVCVPSYFPSATNVFGFCMPVRPSTTPTIGQACNERAGLDSPSSYCGPGAVCFGGRCAKLCDAADLGAHDSPTCEHGKSCIALQDLDLVADYQFGGCGDPCDPFTTFDKSGCANYCGGPPARCEWLGSDPKIGQPNGYCAAAVKTPGAPGSPCTATGVDSCESGSVCLRSTGGDALCYRLCDPGSTATANHKCPSSQTCRAFDRLSRSGYCQ